MAKMKRLDINHGGHKDGITFIVAPALRQSGDKAAFLAQPEIAALRTGRIVTRDANSYVKVCDTAGEIPMGIVSFGFLDRLDTRISANAGCLESGEGLTVALGRFGTTFPKTTDFFVEIPADLKAGTELCTSVGKGGKIKIGTPTGDEKSIGYISLVNDDSVIVEFKL